MKLTFLIILLSVFLNGCSILSGIPNLHYNHHVGTTSPDEILMGISYARHNFILILGKDSDKKDKDKILEVASILERQRLVPIVLRDQKDIDGMSLHEKLIINASISKCVIVIDYSISGHVYELAVLDYLRTPTAIFRKPNMGSTYMVADIAFERGSASIFETNDTNLESVVIDSIKWCDSYNEKKAHYLIKTYPWREKNKTFQPMR